MLGPVTALVFRMRAGNARGRWTAALTLLLTALTLLLPAQVHAHGALQRSEPGQGAHLSTAPRELRLTFNGSVELAVARLQLIGPDSASVELGPLALDPDSAPVLIAPVQGGLMAGIYTVVWQVAGADGHPVRGTYTFVIAPGAAGLAGPVAPGAAPPPVTHHDPTALPAGEGFDAESPLYVLVRWVTYLALAGVIGATAFRFAVLPLARLQGYPSVDHLLGPAAARAARLGLAAASLAGLAAVLRLYAQSYALHGGARALEPALMGTMLTRTLWGWGWLLQAAGTALAVGGFAAARPRLLLSPIRDAAPAEPVPMLVGAASAPAPAYMDAERSDAAPPSAQAISGAPWLLAGLGALALALAPALSGHAAAAPRLGPFAILADALHVLAAGGWIGGLLVLVAAGGPAAMRLEREERGPAVAALVNAFSPTALAFAGALTLTGLFAAWLHMGSIPTLWESAYGRTLLVKLGVLSGVFATGAYNWLKVKPALRDEFGAARLRRSAKVEIAIGSLVLLVTAVLVATAPPMRL
ncbi:MAG TPA: copper resistance protein CopC [Longimicrobium sp.]|nr:copper resistance protein CopC [Longimicrobium sp.]